MSQNTIILSIFLNHLKMINFIFVGKMYKTRQISEATWVLIAFGKPYPSFLKSKKKTQKNKNPQKTFLQQGFPSSCWPIVTSFLINEVSFGLSHMVWEDFHYPETSGVTNSQTSQSVNPNPLDHGLRGSRHIILNQGQ